MTNDAVTNDAVTNDAVTNDAVTYDYEALYRTLTRRYGAVEPEALVKVLCPLHVPLASLDRTIVKLPGQSHYRASFTVTVTDEARECLVVGRTGKFIPVGHLDGKPWREIAKGRIVSVDEAAGMASGEIYIGATANKAMLARAVADLDETDILEVDQYGASAKILSALVESTLATHLVAEGYTVRRMPEDTARHLGVYPNYDFLVSRAGVTRKLEVKSLWGTDTRYARLIHGTGPDYPTSSCKYTTQDFFAVSLFLRTGDIRDFAFARSVPASLHPHGIPHAAKHPEHVHQNPLCEPGNGVWFSDLAAVWHLP